ncbi:MAG: phosphoglycerate kinase, partial [Clostridiales bacterium]|nr:phosphoglycerate kinase [Clostridiales bacterium]
PEDVVAAAKFAAGAEHKNVKPHAIPADWQALDIGDVTRQKFAEIIAASNTIVWNGPVGVFELDDFAAGTVSMAQAVADSGAFSIVGGGDSIAALHKMGLASSISHISTGGGAMLKFLEGKKMPGIEALNDN